MFIDVSSHLYSDVAAGNDNNQARERPTPFAVQIESFRRLVFEIQSEVFGSIIRCPVRKSIPCRNCHDKDKDRKFVGPAHEAV